MANCIVITADGARARMFLLENDDALHAGSRLVEKIDLVNRQRYVGGGAQLAFHRSGVARPT